MTTKTGPFLSRLRLPETAPDARRPGESLSAYLDRILRSGPSPQREELEQWLRRASQRGARSAEETPARVPAAPDKAVSNQAEKQRAAAEREAKLNRLKDFPMLDVRRAADRLGVQINNSRELYELPVARRLAIVDALELMIKVGQIEDPVVVAARERKKTSAGTRTGGLFQRRSRQQDPSMQKKLELLRRFRLSDVQRAARALGISVTGWEDPDLLRSIDPISNALEMMLNQGKIKLQE